VIYHIGFTFVVTKPILIFLAPIKTVVELWTWERRDVLRDYYEERNFCGNETVFRGKVGEHL